MRIDMKHDLPGSVDVVWAAVMDPAYEAALAAHAGVDREVLSEGTERGLRVRRVRLTFREPLAPALARVLGADRLRYEQHDRIDPAARLLKWEVLAPEITDRLSARGSYRLLPAPDGTVRHIEGEVTVNLPLVGARVERAIGERLAKGYEESARFLAAWIRQRTGER